MVKRHDATKQMCLAYAPAGSARTSTFLLSFLEPRLVLARSTIIIPLCNRVILRLLVDVFNAPEPGNKVGAYSTSSPSRVYGKPETFNLLRFDPPHHFHLTPCDLSLGGKDEYGNSYAAWFVPKTDQDWEFDSDAFVVANDDGGYPAGPEALSPIARPVHYFGTESLRAKWVCGPHLSYRKGEKTQNFDVPLTNMASTRTACQEETC